MVAYNVLDFCLDLKTTQLCNSLIRSTWGTWETSTVNLFSVKNNYFGDQNRNYFLLGFQVQTAYRAIPCVGSR